MKILVIQQKMIGDVLTSSILFEVLRRKYPNAQLDYLINEHTFPVVENNPFIDNYIFFSKKEESSKKALLQLGLSVRKRKYDIVIDVYSKLSSNIISLLSSAETKISYKKSYSSFIYNHNIKLNRSGSNLAIENRLNLLSPLNIKAQQVSTKIYLTNKESTNAKQFLESHAINLSKPLFMISVLGSSSNKTYPLKYMARLIDHLVSKTNGQILFNYIPSQLTEAETIYNLCKETTRLNIFFNVFGKSLREFLAISSHCIALIGNEGGAINMAKALDVPTFSIFSPWIKKEAWNLFENDTTNTSVHLKDFNPDIYINKTMKDLKKDVFYFYEIFSPELIIPKLNLFLNQL